MIWSGLWEISHRRYMHMLVDEKPLQNVGHAPSCVLTRNSPAVRTANRTFLRPISLIHTVTSPRPTLSSPLAHQPACHGRPEPLLLLHSRAAVPAMPVPP